MGVILVGVDGSSQARDAVVAGALLASAQGDELVLVHARSRGPLESLLGGGSYEQLIRGIVEEALTAAALAEVPSPTMELVSDVSPAVALQRFAVRDDARAIVVGSSHRGPIGRVAPGGVAQRLLSGAPCPVVVAPGGYAEQPPRSLGRIGCGFDASEGAHAAWRTACAIAGASATLRAIAVYQRLAFAHIPSSMATTWRSVNDELRDDLKRELDALVATAPEGVRAEPVFVEGVAATALIEASEDLDILVVGSRGYGPLGSVLVGSVAAQLIVHAACPLMVVPRPSR
jgi:nucleotide-binding universal stress UspA family protein